MTKKKRWAERAPSMMSTDVGCFSTLPAHDVSKRTSSVSKIAHKGVRIVVQCLSVVFLSLLIQMIPIKDSLVAVLMCLCAFCGFAVGVIFNKWRWS